MPNELKPCPNCATSGKKLRVNRIMFSGSIFDKHLFFIECPSCHWCGKTKLFLWRAKRAWNKENINERNIW
jgi:hypothetical protein